MAYIEKENRQLILALDTVIRDTDSRINDMNSKINDMDSRISEIEGLPGIKRQKENKLSQKETSPDAAQEQARERETAARREPQMLDRARTEARAEIAEIKRQKAAAEKAAAEKAAAEKAAAAAAAKLAEEEEAAAAASEKAASEKAAQEPGPDQDFRLSPESDQSTENSDVELQRRRTEPKIRMKYSAKDGNNTGAPEYRRLTINNYMRTSLNISKYISSRSSYQLEGSVPEKKDGVAGSEGFTTKIDEQWEITPHNEPGIRIYKTIREPENARNKYNHIFDVYELPRSIFVREERSGQVADEEADRKVTIKNNYDSDITFTYTPLVPRNVSEFDKVRASDSRHGSHIEFSPEMDSNIKLFLGREDEEEAAESGKCSIKIINKFSNPVQVCYKNVGDHPWRNYGEVLKVDGERQITTYQGVSWGVKIPGDESILAYEVIESGFRNNILIIENKKYRNVSIKLLKPEKKGGQIVRDQYVWNAKKGDKFEIKDNAFPEVSKIKTIEGDSKKYTLRITDRPPDPTLSVASGQIKKKKKKRSKRKNKSKRASKKKVSKKR